MVTETLEFESPQFVQSLFAGELSLLKSLEKDTGVKIVTREGWLRLEGEAEAVAKARQVFAQLEEAVRSGGEMSAQSFRYAVNAVLKPDGDGEERLAELTKYKLLGGARKPGVSPKTRHQLHYLKAIESHDVTFGVGPAGTGKTYLAMAAGIAALKAKKVGRLVLTRPAVEAGEALGFLPGDMNEKVLPYLRPLYDALYDMVEPDEAEKWIERGMIEIAPLAFMRGRTLSRAFIILDEAQNTSRAQMLMFLTRLGEGSKCVVTGDPSQVDLRDGGSSGLREAIGVLKGIDEIAFVQFDGADVVRHPVVARIVEAYDRARK